MDSNEFLISRDVSFEEKVFPYEQKKDVDVEIRTLTGGSDDDWIINGVEDNRVSGSPEIDEEMIDNVQTEKEVPSPLSVIPEQDKDGEQSNEVEVVKEADKRVSTVKEPELGRGCREKRPSVKLRDYVNYNACSLAKENPDHGLTSSTSTSESSITVQGTLYPLTNYISDDKFSPAHMVFLAAITNMTEPRNFKEAMEQKIWWDSMAKEITAFEVNKMFSVVDLPPGKKAIGNMWIYKYKYNADGTMETPKYRLVVLGNRQVKGRSFIETFAPVAKMTTIRCLLRVVAGKGWIMHQMDVHNTFLYGDLKEEVYMKLPQGFQHSGGPNKVCKLHKAIYGLRQAPRCWFAKLTTALKRFGFQHSYADYSLFVYLKGNVELRVLIYVNDLLICGNNKDFLTKFKEHLGKCFHMKDLGKLKYFLGIEVGRGEEGFMLTQRKYTPDLIADVGLLGSKPVATPMEIHHKLAIDLSPFMRDAEKYRRLVGRLIYLSITRPDISYAVHILSQFMQMPREAQWDAALRVVKYLKGTAGQGILLSSQGDMRLSVYCDADWSACPTTRRSLSAYVALVGEAQFRGGLRSKGLCHTRRQSLNTDQWHWRQEK